MSDVPRGEGWWQASDGNYYPPSATSSPDSGRPLHRRPGFRWAAGATVVVCMIIAGLVWNYIDLSNQVAPQPSAAEEAELIAQIQEIYPGVDRQVIIDAAVSTCQDMIDLKTSDEILARIPARFGRGASVPLSADQAESILRVVQNAAFC